MHERREDTLQISWTEGPGYVIFFFSFLVAFSSVLSRKPRPLPPARDWCQQGSGGTSSVVRLGEASIAACLIFI